MHKWIFVFLAVLICACNPCRYGCDEGICVRGSCDCFEWYEGDACERLITAMHVGEYSGELVDANADTILRVLNFRLVTTANAPNAMLMQEEGLTITFDDTYRFHIAEQAWLGYTVTGEGEILLDGMGIRLELVNNNRQISSYSYLQRLE
jgi:hypothetical protein